VQEGAQRIGPERDTSLPVTARAADDRRDDQKRYDFFIAKRAKDCVNAGSAVTLSVRSWIGQRPLLAPLRRRSETAEGLLSAADRTCDSAKLPFCFGRREMKHAEPVVIDDIQAIEDMIVAQDWADIIVRTDHAGLECGSRTERGDVFKKSPAEAGPWARPRY